MPQITGSITSSVGVNNLTFESDASDTDKIAAIQTFFKLECHNDDNSVNFCPSGVAASDSNKFTAQTLIGLVYLAEMKGKDIYNDSAAKFKTCEAGVTHSALTNHIAYYDIGGGPGTFEPVVLPFGSLLDCVSTFTETSGANTNTTYSAYSKATTGDVYAYVSSRKGAVTSLGTMSDVFQGYMSKSGGNPEVVAFNLASYNLETASTTFGNRVVLIVNVTTHKFAVKTGDGNGNSLMAMGKAGYDPSTGTYTDGYFVVRVLTNTAARVYCIKNSATPTVVAGSNCTDIVVGLGTTSGTGWSAAQVATYLGMNSTDAANVADFITGNSNFPSSTTGINNSTEIGYPEAPCNVSSTCDDLHFPITITSH